MIDSFKGSYRFLSNFYPSPIVAVGRRFPTVEHAFQAMKTLDERQRKLIQKCETPGEAKRMGRTITLRPGWENMKVRTMLELLELKFEPGTSLANRLLATGDEDLVEGNHWNDTFWGVCRGKGENWLGKSLMTVRTQLQEAQ